MITLLKYIRSLEIIDYLYLVTGKSLDCINPKLDKLPNSIIFVCTGNICRSAYAEKKFYSMFINKDVIVSSAGLDTEEGKQADPKAHEIALKRKINLKSHRTQVASLEKLKNAELILVMDNSHYDKIPKHLRDKVKYLGCFTNDKTISIKDPYGKSDEVFEECFNKIDAALEGLRSELKMHTNFGIEDSKVDTTIID